MARSAERELVQYNRDVRPILSDRCFQCHGPDEKTRQAGLRLDVKESAYAAHDSGEVAITPGKPEASELVRRITAADEFERMPLPESGKKLSARDIDILKRWIAQGAEYQGHWAFLRPRRPDVPEVRSKDHVRNAIDAFVLRRLEREGLKPAPQADKETLIRRVTLDLTGLPPEPQEIDAFLADDSPGAYEALVDRLLRSPRYGEQMARYWLDAARYGDTHGLHLDNVRSIWPYREWVIEAFNRNMPFDEFTVEQLAGDLLPDPTLEQRVATGFNRCNVTTSEGGSIDKEYIVRYAIDRVETTSTVWMGMTLGCAVCHDHKFDPFTQKEFYQFFAFFNSGEDRAMDGNALLPPPSVQVATAEQKAELARLGEQTAAAEKQIAAAVSQVKYEEPAETTVQPPSEHRDFVWIDDDLPAGAQAQASGEGGGWNWVPAEKQPAASGQRSTVRTADGLGQHFFTGANKLLQLGEGDKLFAHVWLDPANPPRQIMLQFNDGTWEHRACWGEDAIDWGQKDTPSRHFVGPLPETGKWVRLEVAIEAVGLKPGAALNGWAFTQFGGTVYWDQAGSFTRTAQGPRSFDSLAAWARSITPGDKSLPKSIQDIAKVAPERRNAGQRKQLREHFLEHVYSKSRETFAPLHQQLAQLKSQRQTMEKSFPSTLVMKEMTNPRPAFVLERGQYDREKEKVERNVPAALPPLPEDAPRSRLGLARWLVDPAHPLTARVTVNRFWQHFFGTGIVKTSEDFGSQGDWPSHPELLDWLAVEFVESGWNVKELQKQIVMSATYRQSSQAAPELFARDRENRLLARGPRFRMDAEMVRDAALYASGLLVEKLGGPSVRPYQPPGLWEAVGYTSSNTAKFKRDDGQALYRRSMYTFWKRTAPPPTMLIFDAPSRETCTVRRERTNTPLAALALMNDEQFVEAARAFGQRMMTAGGGDVDARLTFGFRWATSRRPTEQELNVLRQQYQQHLAHFQKDTEAATKLIAVGESKADAALDSSELAAWTMIGNLLLNLNEAITKG